MFVVRNVVWTTADWICLPSNFRVFLSNAIIDIDTDAAIGELYKNVLGKLTN